MLDTKNTTTPTAIRPELEALSPRLQRLPVDDRGYPVPWFVAWVDGKPEFRAMDGAKWLLAVRERRCWVCGDRLGAYMTFVIGPMCGINRTTAEPGCHLDCAEWSARNCPFLSRPQMVRREDDFLNNEHLVEESAGTAITRNPGVALLWTTKQFHVFNDGQGKPLIHLGDPTAVRWYAEGRPATRAEVLQSVDSGFPALLSIAEEQDRKEGCGAVKALQQYRARFEQFLPAGAYEPPEWPGR